MALQNNLRVQVDKPVWEWSRFAPVVSTAVSAACSADNSKFHPNNGRYIYYLIGATSFWRYDTWSDTYLQLASPSVANATWTTMRFAGGQGFRGRVLSATSNTITGGVFGTGAVGYEIRIVGGTGMGQRRVITAVSDPIVADSGVATAATGTYIQDTSKGWTTNQWVGYVFRVVYGTGVNTFRRILNNNVAQLNMADTTQYAYDYECNPAAMVLSSAAGAQSVYNIESSTITVDTAWDVQPDATSRFLIASGAIFMMSASGTAPFYTLQQYDVLSDTWYQRNATSTQLAAAPTDARLERVGDNASLWERGRATGGSATTLVDTTKQWTANQWVGYNVRIFSGTGRGGMRAITANTTNTLTIASGTALDATSYYMIDGFDSGTATSGTSLTMTDSAKTWATNQWRGFNLIIVDGTAAGQSQTIASNTGTAITVVRPFATTPDATSKYVIRGDSDKMYVAFGGLSQLFHQDLETDLMTTSRQLDCGVSRPGGAQYSDHTPVAVTSALYSAGTVTVNTTAAHNFKTGMTVKHYGDTSANAAANNISAVITVTGSTSYTYSAPGGGTWTLPAGLTTALTDGTKAWTTNQWAGYLVTYSTTQGPSGGTVTAQIASNTATTLTFVAAATTPATGISRYAIHARASLGAQESGLATGTQSTTTLQDTSKSWASNQWAGKRLRMLSSTGQSVEVAVASNTSNTLTFGVTTAPTNGATAYSILGVTARGTGLCLEWASGLSDVTTRGRYIYSARGGALVGFDRYDITNDSWLAVNTTPQTESLTTGSMYAYDGGDRVYFTKEVTQRVYYLDLKTMWMHGASLYPYTAGTAILGNRMEIFQTADGLKYLWLNRHSNLECFMQLCFY